MSSTATGMVPTVGVEEEFILVDADTGHTMPIGPSTATACPQWPVTVQTEFTPTRIEIATGVCGDLHQLRRHLRIGRARVAELASGTAASPSPAARLP